MSVDYVVDETLRRKDNNNLLDPDTGVPNPELTSPSEKALAEVAAALHKNLGALSGKQLEQVASWAKRWKLVKSRKQTGTRNDFFAILDVLKNSAEQKKLQKKTLWKLLFGAMAGAVFAVALLSMAIANWSDNDLGWGWQFGLGVVLFVGYVLTTTFVTDALLIAKEQDRRYALASLRKAQSVVELNEAGLFAYLPKTRLEEVGFEDKEAMQIIRGEVERLTDALYNDPDDWLLNHEYPGRNGETTD